MPGAAQAALRMAAADAGERQQFGPKQAIKHPLAECRVALDDAGLALLERVWPAAG